MVLHYAVHLAVRHVIPHVVHHIIARQLAVKGKSMFAKIGLWLAGSLITPAVVKYLLDEAVKYLKDAAAKTASPLDDQAIAFIEKSFDDDATAEKLAAFLLAALKAGK